MSPQFDWANGLQALLVFGMVGAADVPLGDYMARVYTRTSHLPLERVIYRLCGVDPQVEQPWTRYLASLLAFSATSIFLLFGLLRLQPYLPFAEDHPGVPPALAFNTAVSFTTNTSWQNYAGEATLGHTALAVGMAAGVALVRGSLRVLLPLLVVFAVVLMACGVVQNLHGPSTLTTLAGVKQTILGGPVASWEPIKLLSGDGGGAFNVNSAHPFENPNPLSSVLETVMMPLVPVAFIRLFGRMIGSLLQGSR